MLFKKFELFERRYRAHISKGGEINQIFRNAFDRIVLEGEDIATVLQEEGDNLQALMDETGAPCWAPDPAGDGPCVVNP